MPIGDYMLAWVERTCIAIWFVFHAFETNDKGRTYNMKGKKTIMQLIINWVARVGFAGHAPLLLC